jgi:hypothetical protein
MPFELRDQEPDSIPADAAADAADAAAEQEADFADAEAGRRLDVHHYHTGHPQLA